MPQREWVMKARLEAMRLDTPEPVCELVIAHTPGLAGVALRPAATVQRSPEPVNNHRYANS